MTGKSPETMTDAELYQLFYEQFQILELTQQNLRLLNQEIAKRRGRGTVEKSEDLAQKS